MSFSASSTQCSWRTSGRRVHIPAPLGKKSRPTIASRTLLLPLDWPPTTTICGRHRHTDGRSWRRVASTLSPASAHASWVGGARGSQVGVSLRFGLPRGKRCLSGGRGVRRAWSRLTSRRRGSNGRDGGGAAGSMRAWVNPARRARRYAREAERRRSNNERGSDDQTVSPFSSWLFSNFRSLQHAP